MLGSRACFVEKGSVGSDGAHHVPESRERVRPPVIQISANDAGEPPLTDDRDHREGIV